MPAYRPEIDGLRSVAVLPVLLFHAGLPPFNGGFVGVDVFFVISGYLITSIILEEMQSGKFTFANFYERRARRILPALFFVVLICIPLGWNWLLVREFKEMLQSIAAATLSLSNVFFWIKSDYFADNSDFLILLHTWSLGVEEQFYIIFPGLLFLLIKGKTLTGQMWRWCLLILSFFAVCSFVANVALISDYPMLVYYLLPFRGWELMVGALCAVFHARHGIIRNNLLATLGAAALVYSLVFYNKSTVFPGTAALVPVLGTALMIMFAEKSTLIGRCLSLPPLVFVGLISYSLYLWHQPVLAFARHYFLDPLTNPQLGLLLILTFGLAIFTWHFIERPFRRRGSDALISRRSTLFAVSTASMLSLTTIGLAGHFMEGFPSRLSAEERRVAAEGGWNSKCMRTRSDPLKHLPDPACIANPGQSTRVALIGDSVMSSLSPAMSEMFASHGYEVHQITHSHCTLNTNFRRMNHNASPCPEFVETALDFLERESFDIVVHAGNLIPFLNGADGEVVDTNTASPTQDTAAILDEMIANAEKLPGQFVFLLPYQNASVNVLRRSLKEMRTKGRLVDYLEVRNGSSGEAQQAAARVKASSNEDWILLNPDDVFCSEVACAFVEEGIVRLSDRVHFTRAGADQIALHLQQLLKQNGLLGN